MMNAMTTAERDIPSVPVSWRQLRRDLAYLLLGFPIGLGAFVAVITGMAVGIGLVVIWVGIPILVMTLAIARGFAALERARVRSCERRSLPAVYYRPSSGGWFGGAFAALRDPQYWRDVAHALISFPVRVVTWSIAIAWLAVTASSVTYILYGWVLARQPDNETLWDLLGVESVTAGVLLQTALGLVFLLAMPYVMRWTAIIDTTLARLMLTNPGAAENARLRARTEQLRASRAAAVEAEATTLRRVERDIHDGPQQRLVRLTMDLEAAQRRLDDDPDSARPLVAEALEQTQEALAELRALSRGIAPPILADRGLEAALAASASRCPVPIELEVALGPYERPAPAAENAAYFVVAEALTNVAKHSGAATARVSVVRVADDLHIQVADDGAGGAHIGKGHGLAGLTDRLSGIDGELDVHSPPGGGTLISARIPVAQTSAE